MTWIAARCLCGILALLMVSTGGVGWAADPIDWSKPYARMNVGIVGGGVAAAGGCAISDDFSSNTAANYYAIRGSGRGVSVSGGALWPENLNSDGHQYHTTNINNNDHYVQADILLTDADDRGGLVARCNGNTTSATGYAFAPATNSVQFYRFAGATQTYIGAFTVAWTNGQTHTLRIRVTGNDFYAWVDGNASSSNPITDTTYSSGTYVGTRFEANGTSGSVDNFKADTATTCMN